MNLQRFRWLSETSCNIRKFNGVGIFYFSKIFRTKTLVCQLRVKVADQDGKKTRFCESACLTISSMRYRGKANKFARTEAGKQTLDDIGYLLSSTHKSARAKITKISQNICRFVINESATRLFIEPAVFEKIFFIFAVRCVNSL